MRVTNKKRCPTCKQNSIFDFKIYPKCRKNMNRSKYILTDKKKAEY